MSAPACRVVQPTLFSAVGASERQWWSLSELAPEMVATMGRYLAQVATFLAPASVAVADHALRQLAGFLSTQEPPVTTVAEVTRPHLEAFKVWLSAQPGRSGALSANARRQRLGTLRAFFERLIEWGWEDAPARNPILAGDLPSPPEPLPKFLDDRRAARLMAAAGKASLRDHLVVAMLARTGMRVGELCGLAADAVVMMGSAHWLRVPVGKLRNDRFLPLHPELVELLSAWTARNVEPIRRHRLLMADEGGPMNRYQVARIVKRLGREAGIGHVHPHQLRHTLATQALHRGMRLEAIATLLGHRSMEMTMTYARITDRAVADQYAAVAAQVDALYGHTSSLPAEAETAPMARLRREATARMLGNGLCTRPIELDCRMESACETCTYFRTNIEFTPTLRRQRDHAQARGQTDRAALFQRLLDRVEGGNT